MYIRAGYDIAFDLPQVTPMILTLTVDASRMKDVVSGHNLRTTPNIPTHHYRDMFGNTCTRVLAPQGRIEFETDFVIYDTGLPDDVCIGTVDSYLCAQLGAGFATDRAL